MTTSIVPNTFKHVVTFGNPYHGLNINSVLTLSNGSTVAGVMDSSKRRIGDCYEVRVPGVSYTDPQSFGNHLKFEPYALISGFEDRRLYNYKIHLGDKNTFIYCDANKDRWLVTVDPTPAGTKTAFLMNVTLKKFGEFFGTPQTYSYQLSVGDPAITTTTTAGYKYEVVNFNKDGSLAIIGLCLEDSTTESQSTCPFDRAYGYPLAFLKLQITNKTTLSASVYRSKTYCERTSTTIPTPSCNYQFIGTVSRHTTYTNASQTVRVTDVIGENKDFYLRNMNTLAYIHTPAALPANTSTSTWSWDTLSNAFSTNLGTTYTGNYLESIRTIHVFIKDDNSLVDVECLNIADSLSYNSYCTFNTKSILSDADAISLAQSLLSNISGTRDMMTNTGTITFTIPEYNTSRTGSNIDYCLKIGGSIKSSVSFNSRTNTDKVNQVTNWSGTVSSTPATTNTYPDNTYTGPSAGTISAVPLTSYKNYKGWMSKGTYTLVGGTQVTPFIQLYTNNLVGMVEGNGNTSNPDNAHWDTGSGGSMVAMPIFNKKGSVVSSQQSINALTRYCSWHPVNNTFSGLYSVPVCYV